MNRNEPSFRKSSPPSRAFNAMIQTKIQFNLANAKRYFREHLGAGDYYSPGRQVAKDVDTTKARYWPLKSLDSKPVKILKHDYKCPPLDVAGASRVAMA